MIEKYWEEIKIQPLEHFNKFVQNVQDYCAENGSPPTPLPILKFLFYLKIQSIEELKSFFTENIEDIHDPFLMKDIEKAIERIKSAFEKKEKILVYGDYDVDGTTAVSMMYDFLTNFSQEIEYYIPDRLKEGYGISSKGVKYAKENKIKLLISLDCGISSYESLDYCHQNGIDVIVCDHHITGAKIPKVFAALDPMQNDCKYPNKYLSGCGVGYKLICAYCKKYDLNDDYHTRYLDLLCLSIASDIVPIIGENRFFAKKGLKMINNNPSEGVKALKRKAEIDKFTLDISHLVFRIGPAINAAGRLAHAKTAVELLTTRDRNLAEKLADKLYTYNDSRKDTEKDIVKEAIQIIESDKKFESKFSHILYQSNWYKGVLGIVASKLVEKYRRPILVLTQNEDKTLTGSGRTVSNLNLYDTVKSCSEYILQFGGHEAAVGLTMEEKNLNNIRTIFENEVKQNIHSTDYFLEKIKYVSSLNFDEITPVFIAYIKKLEPHGPKNLKPIFHTSNVYAVDHIKKLGDNHIKTSISQDNNTIFPTIGFDLGKKFAFIKPFQKFDIIYNIVENEWNGKKTIQLNLKDIKIVNNENNTTK